MAERTRIVCLSDTHGKHESVQLPDGDVLVFAGDYTLAQSAEELAKFAAWLQAQPHAYKMMIAGNHDWWFERSAIAARKTLAYHAPDVLYLEDSGATIAGLKF